MNASGRLAVWLPVAQFGLVATSLGWGLAPPSLLPTAPLVVAIYGPALAIFLLLAFTVLVLVRGWSRAPLVWAGLSVLVVPAAFEALVVWAWLTFPADW